MMEFLKQRVSLLKPLPKHYFTNFCKDLSNEELVTLCGLLVIEIEKPQKRLYAILGR
jgi:hypothetical protein